MNRTLNPAIETAKVVRCPCDIYGLGAEHQVLKHSDSGGPQEPGSQSTTLAAVTGSSIIAKVHKVDTILCNLEAIKALDGRACMHPIGVAVVVVESLSITRQG